MTYPTYKKKAPKNLIKPLVYLQLVVLPLSLIIKGVFYLEATLVFVTLALWCLKKHKGFKAISGLHMALLIMVTLIDLGDLKLTWALNYVMPAFFITLSLLMFIMVMVEKKSWKTNDTLHLYFITTAMAMVTFLIQGIMDAWLLAIVSLSIFIVSLLAIWLRVGRAYHQSILKHLHM